MSPKCEEYTQLACLSVLSSVVPVLARLVFSLSHAENPTFYTLTARQGINRSQTQYSFLRKSPKMFKKAALLAVGVQALPLHEPRGRRLPPDTVAFCVPPMGSGAAIEGAAEGLADYTGYRAVLLVGAAADGSMGWWDKTCGFPFHPACPGGGLGYPLEADGSFTMAGWAR